MMRGWRKTGGSIKMCWLNTQNSRASGYWYIREKQRGTVFVEFRISDSTTGVSEKNTPPEKNEVRKISLQSAKSGAGEQFLPLDCRAELDPKGVSLFTGTGISTVFHRPIKMGNFAHATSRMVLAGLLRTAMGD